MSLVRLKVYSSRFGQYLGGGTAAIENVWDKFGKCFFLNIICRIAQNIITNYKKEEQ